MNSNNINIYNIIFSKQGVQKRNIEFKLYGTNLGWGKVNQGG